MSATTMPMLGSSCSRAVAAPPPTRRRRAAPPARLLHAALWAGALLWRQPAAGLRLQDDQGSAEASFAGAADVRPRAEAATEVLRPRAAGVKGAIAARGASAARGRGPPPLRLRLKEQSSQVSLFDRYNASLAQRGAANTQQTPTSGDSYDDIDLVATGTVWFQGAFDLSSFNNLAISLAYNDMRVLDAPAVILALSAAGHSMIISGLESKMRLTAWEAQQMIDSQKAEMRHVIRDLLLNSDNVFVSSWVPEKLKVGLAETGIALIGNAGIGFHRRGEEISAVIEVPWVKPEVSAQLCDGLAQVGPQTPVLYFPFILAASLMYLAGNLPRIAGAILLFGAIMLSGPVFRPICGHMSASLVTVPHQRVAFNLTSADYADYDLGEYVAMGLPEVFGFNTSFDDDAFRVHLDWISVPMIERLAKQVAVGMEVVTGGTIKDLNLDLHFENYKFEILPSTFVTAAMDLKNIEGMEAAFGVKAPPTKECVRIQSRVFFWQSSSFLCYYRIKIYFAGGMDTNRLGDLDLDLELQYIAAINADSRVHTLIENGDTNMLSKATHIFREETNPLQDQMFSVQKAAKQVIVDIVDQSAFLRHWSIPEGFVHDFRDTVFDQVDNARFHFDTQGEDVVIKVEVPNVAPQVTSAVCGRTSEAVNQPMRMAPIIGIALLLAWRFPRTAVALVLLGGVATTQWATRHSCEFLAPSILSDTQEKKHFIFLPNTSYELGFPSSINYTQVFEGDVFAVTFDPIKIACFNKLADKVIKHDEFATPEQIEHDNSLDEEVERSLVNSQAEIRMQGYRIEFTANSWLASNGNIQTR